MQLEIKLLQQVGSMGLFLNAGQSGVSSSTSVLFTTLPSTAKIRSIKVEPGRNTSAGMGAIVGTNLMITSPDGITESLAWSPHSMSSNSIFLNHSAKGVWELKFSAQNISSYNYGSLSYKSAKITISYVY